MLNAKLLMLDAQCLTLNAIKKEKTALPLVEKTPINRI